jgi:hypothetical protein
MRLPISAWYSRRTRGLGERGEAAQIEKDDRDLPAMAFEGVFGTAREDRLRQLR